MARFSLIVAMALFLAGCAVTPTPIIIQEAPFLVQYSPEKLSSVAAQLRNCEDCDDVSEFVTDYGQLRDALRAGSE